MEIGVARKGVARNIFGECWKEKFVDLRLSGRAAEGAGLAASEELLIGCLESSGGGSVGAVELSEVGKRKPKTTLFRGHKGPVTDIQICPFYPAIFATSSEDGTVKLWDCPVATETTVVRDSVATLHGHGKKVCVAAFNPCAEWIIASAGADGCVRVWDMEQAGFGGLVSAQLAAQPTCLRWNETGSLLATVTRNRTLAIIDPRCAEGVPANPANPTNPTQLSASVVGQVLNCNEGAKPARCEWLTGARVHNEHWLLTCGFSKSTAREMVVWDLRMLTSSVENPEAKKRLVVDRAEIDRQSAAVVPFWDESLAVLYVQGKGDGNVRIFEIAPDDDALSGGENALSGASKENALSGSGNGGVIQQVQRPFFTPEAGREFAWLPKRAVKVMDCEVARLYKAQPGEVVQPISFHIPRRNMSQFHSDLFPPCHSGHAALSADEWRAGQRTSPLREPMDPVDGINPFLVPQRKRAPVDAGNLSFSKRRLTTSAVDNAPSVLNKRLTYSGLNSDLLAARVAELETALTLKDRELAAKESERETLQRTLARTQAEVRELQAVAAVQQSELQQSGHDLRKSDLEKLRESKAVDYRHDSREGSRDGDRHEFSPTTSTTAVTRTPSRTDLRQSPQDSCASPADFTGTGGLGGGGMLGASSPMLHASGPLDAELLKVQSTAQETVEKLKTLRDEVALTQQQIDILQSLILSSANTAPPATLAAGATPADASHTNARGEMGGVGRTSHTHSHTPQTPEAVGLGMRQSVSNEPSNASYDRAELASLIEKMLARISALERSEDQLRKRNALLENIFKQIRPIATVDNFANIGASAGAKSERRKDSNGTQESGRSGRRERERGRGGRGDVGAEATLRSSPALNDSIFLPVDKRRPQSHED